MRTWYCFLLSIIYNCKILIPKNRFGQIFSAAKNFNVLHRSTKRFSKFSYASYSYASIGLESKYQ